MIFYICLSWDIKDRRTQLQNVSLFIIACISDRRFGSSAVEQPVKFRKQLGNSTPYPVGLEASGDLQTPYRSLNQPKSKVHVTHRNDTEITTVFSQNSLPYLAFSDSARFDCVDITRLYMALTVVLVCIFGVEYLNTITRNITVTP